MRKVPKSNKKVWSVRWFGKLTVKAKIGKYSTGDPKWLCDCECGRQTKTRHTHLKYGCVSSCGKCGFEDFTNQKIGNPFKTD